MAEATAFENLRISNFQRFVTLTLDRVIPHTVVHQSSTSTYMPNFIEIKDTFCGQTDLPSSKYVTQKLGQIIKIQPNQI